MKRLSFLLLLLATLPVLSQEAKPKLLALIAEREYETKTTVPAFFEKNLKSKFEISIIQLEDGKNDFAGLEEKLKDTDLLFISVRRRTPTEPQLAAIRKYIASGKPVLGIRTSSHAFVVRNGKAPQGHASWQSWDADVFGGSYSGHLSAKLSTNARVASEHAITKGLPTEAFDTGGSLYKVTPLAEGSRVLLTGRVKGQKDAQPVAWTFTRKDGGKSFYTSLGHVDDFQAPPFTLLLKQACQWLNSSSAKKTK